MKIVPRDVVAAYKVLKLIAAEVTLHKKEAILFFFLNRIFVFCAEEHLVTVEQHEEYVSVFLKMVSDLDKDTSEKYAEMAKARTENLSSDDEEKADVGYFSILSYAFFFLLNHQTDYVNYSSDRYLGSIESYLIDRDSAGIDNEVTNVELLIEALTGLDENEMLKVLPIFGTWASTALVGEILPGFAGQYGETQ